MGEDTGELNYIWEIKEGFLEGIVILDMRLKFNLFYRR
jgi:hypothetical protein